MSANVFRTYPGDCRNYDREHYVGGDGKFYRPVNAVLDGANTVIEFEPVPINEMGLRYLDTMDKRIKKGDIEKLFGAPTPALPPPKSSELPRTGMLALAFGPGAIDPNVARLAAAASYYARIEDGE